MGLENTQQRMETEKRLPADQDVYARSKKQTQTRYPDRKQRQNQEGNAVANRP